MLSTSPASQTISLRSEVHNLHALDLVQYMGERPHLTPGPGRLLGAWQLAASFLLPAAEAGRGALLHGPACGVRGSGDCCALEVGGMWGWPVTAGQVSTWTSLTHR